MIRRILGGNRAEEVINYTRHYKLEETSGIYFYDVNGHRGQLFSGDISTITTPNGSEGRGFSFTSTAINPYEPAHPDFNLREGTVNKPFFIEFDQKSKIASSLALYIMLRQTSTNNVVRIHVSSNIPRFEIHKTDGTQFGCQFSTPQNYTEFRRFKFQYIPNDPNFVKFFLDGVEQPVTLFGTEGEIKLTQTQFWFGGLEREGIMDEIKLKIG